MPADKISRKRALVCGASRGIGEAIANTLVAQGYEVVPLARNEDKLSGWVKNANQSQGYIACDVLDKEALRQAVEKNISEHGNFSVLINNTGGPKSGPIEMAEKEEFMSALEAHLFTNMLLAKLCLPGMKKQSFGRIINVISTSVKIPLKGLGVSNTVRGAVANWSKTLANEVASDGVTVNAVLPGATSTQRLTEIIEAKSKRQQKSLEEVTQEMLSEIPAQRFGQPEEIASLVGYLCSDPAGYITGTAIPVDGGRTGCL